MRIEILRDEGVATLLVAFLVVVPFLDAVVVDVLRDVYEITALKIYREAVVVLLVDGVVNVETYDECTIHVVECGKAHWVARISEGLH